MELLLTTQVTRRLLHELRRAGNREIGGLLMGEHVGAEAFRVIDFSVQRSGGTPACFIRNPSEHQRELEAFFARTGGDYTRYNYLGEWHSHPSFDPTPSTTDIRSMQSIADDPAVGVNFVVLLIVKLSGKRQMITSAIAFLPQAVPVPVTITEDQVNFHI
jgi:integrative and conjugative element protein (TIGR02256 family)